MQKGGEGEMSTKISEMSQLFGNRPTEESKKGQAQGKEIQFSSFLKQSTKQTAENFSNQFNMSAKQDYVQCQRKESLVKEAQPMSLQEKTAKIKDKMESYASKVNDILKEELGTTEEEIQNAMETLGLTYADLSKPTNLIQLVSALTGEEATDLLCSEAVVSVMQEVSEVTEELLQTLEMTSEEFMDVCQKMLEQTEEQDLNPVKNETQIFTQSETQDSEMNSGKADATLTEDEQQVQPVEMMTSDSKEVQNRISKEMEESNLSQESITGEKAEKNVDELALTLEKKQEELENSNKETKNLMTEPVTETEKSKSQDKSFGQQQGKQEFTRNTEMFAQSGGQTPTIEVAQGDFQEVYPQTIHVQDIMEQIVQSVRLMTTAHSTTMEMQLNPENLGKIFMEISTREGIVSAKFVAQNEAVKEALEAQMADLKQNLNQSGVKVDAVEITVSTHEFERNLEQNQHQEEQLAEQKEEQEQSGERRRRNLSRNTLDELSGVMSEEETLLVQMMQDNGNSMDVKA